MHLTDTTIKQLPAPTAATRSPTTTRSRGSASASPPPVPAPSSSITGASRTARSAASPSARSPIGARWRHARRPSGSSARSTAVPTRSASRKQSRAAPTVADLCDRFLEDYVPRKSPATQRDYRQQIAADILPALGELKVAAVTFADVDSLHRKISKRAPTHANRVLALLSRMFTMAIRWGMRTDNPVKGIERNAEGKRQRYASGAELARLSIALGRAARPGRGQRHPAAVADRRPARRASGRQVGRLRSRGRDLDEAGQHHEAEKDPHASRCRTRRASCSARCGRKPAMMPSTCSLPVSHRTASTSMTPGRRYARPPTSRTFACTICATPMPACSRRRDCRCR